jgi:hypothetical protein
MHAFPASRIVRLTQEMVEMPISSARRPASAAWPAKRSGRRRFGARSPCVGLHLVDISRLFVLAPDLFFTGEFQYGRDKIASSSESFWRST